MTKGQECVVVAESREAALELTALANEICDSVTVIAAGDREAAGHIPRALPTPGFRSSAHLIHQAPRWSRAQRQGRL